MTSDSVNEDPVNKPHRLKEWMCVGLVMLIVGCGAGQAPPSGTKPDIAIDAAAVKQPVGQTQPNKAPTALPVVRPDDDSALSAVTRTLNAIERGDLAAAYEFLPPSYQADLDGLVQLFAERMDPEIWTKLFQTLRKSVAVLRTKKDFILELDLFRNRPEFEPMRRHWDAAVALLDALATGTASDIASLRQARAKSMLPGDAARIVQQLDAIDLGVGADLARQFSDIKVESVRVNNAEHVLSFRTSREEQPTEVGYVKHEGRWLPKSLIEQWPSGITTDRAWLDRMPDLIKRVKPRLLDIFSQADGILDQLLAAQNREDFQRAAGPAILSLALALPQLEQLAQQSISTQDEIRTVTISINRELSDAELSQLVEAILEPLQPNGTNYTLLANDGRTTCRLSQISDVNSLQKNLADHFKIAIDRVSFDSDAATLKVELDP